MLPMPVSAGKEIAMCPYCNTQLNDDHICEECMVDADGCVLVDAGSELVLPKRTERCYHGVHQDNRCERCD